MRIPLVRSGNDETPTAWWEWLFFPIVMPLGFLFLLGAALISIPMTHTANKRQDAQERQLRDRLASTGRFIEWSDVEARLKSGAGTLVIEHCSMKGPVRAWWTEEDLIASWPVALPKSISAEPVGEQLAAVKAYAKECAAKVNFETGTARLTDAPRSRDPRRFVTVHLGGGLMTAIVLQTGRTFAERYPLGKIATLVAWFDEPLLFAGDAEDVFLAKN